jgi:uncharacterized protein YqgC (DUF456 family)
MIMRVLLTIVLVFGSASSYAGIIAIFIPIASVIYTGVRKPYIALYHNIRAIANDAITVVVLAIYTYYQMAVDYTK